MKFSLKDNLHTHPIDVVENLADDFHWSADRVAEDEINIHIVGEWCKYNLTVHWNPNIDGLHMGIAFDFKPSKDRVIELQKLIMLINEQLWLGHFEYWENSDILMFRYGTLLAEGQGFTDIQCHTIINHSVETCEQYYAAFQFTLWANKTADQALMACLLDITGSA
ncbi:MAG: YbjN domain-containing protein [Rhizobiales bacterium]|nr:YbjN domain-containing protein [Hyphomicrobiales bacterium]NRB14055.1 YbjN domain-containing protein [Hyphomicrobiales bacterium]